MMATLVTLILVVCAYALTWLVTCGFVKLITFCFGLAFSWKIATGIFLVCGFINFWFGRNKKKKKGGMI